ncbi:aminopeptidase N [Demequina sediminicola]|uniref:aminopeptidase N n=1 Tax=Demequina sediminicola TaxID=1095026 RepID=UPI000784F970|nr:aminopeptidase N [Demequina sediminicola]
MLTRTEAAARAQLITSAAYQVELDFTPAGDTFRSRTTVTFDAPAGTETFLDVVGTIHHVEVDGTALDLEQVVSDDRVHVTAGPGTTVVVEADCSYRTDGQGIHRFIDPESGDTYLYSQFATDDARRAFACFDQPDIKGTFAFTVTAPEAWTVISNSPTPEPTPASVATDDGATNDSGAMQGGASAPASALRWEFSPTVPLPCYVAAVVAGPYVSEGGTLTSIKGEIPARVYGRANLAEHLDADEMIATVQAGLELFEQVFGIAYPYEKYDQIFVPEYNLGAMENAGCVTFSEDRLVFRGRVSDAMQEFRANVTLHELSHQWFGNLVTMQWWDDLWLNESFAEFMGAWATSKVTPWTDSWVTFTAERKSIAYVQDQLPTTHPIVAEIADTEATVSAFDMITYAKGASALKQLVAFVGEDTFFAGVRTYLAKYSHGNATLAHFLVELSAAADQDLTEWADAWLETPGPSTLHTDITLTDGSATGSGAEATVASLHVDQQVPAAHPQHRPHQIVVSGFIVDTSSSGESTLARAWEVAATVAGPRTEIEGARGLIAPDLVVLNDRDLTYAKLVLDERSLDTVRRHIGDLKDPMVVGLVLDALWHMVRDALIPATQYIDAVLHALPHITNSETAASHLRTLVTAIGRYVPAAAAVEVREDAADRLWALLPSLSAGSDLQLQVLSGAARLSTTERHAHAIACLLDGDTTLDGVTIDTDLRWELLSGMAVAGADVTDYVEQALAVDGGAMGLRKAAGVKASVATRASKEETWQELVRPEEPIPNAVQYEMGLGLSRTADASQLAPLVPTILGELREYYAANEGFVGKRVATYVFPTWAVGRVEGLDRMLDQWLADNTDAPSVLRKVVTEATDEVRRALRAQEAWS